MPLQTDTLNLFIKSMPFSLLNLKYQKHFYFSHVYSPIFFFLFFHSTIHYCLSLFSFAAPSFFCHFHFLFQLLLSFSLTHTQSQSYYFFSLNFKKTLFFIILAFFVLFVSFHYTQISTIFIVAVCFWRIFSNLIILI